MKKAFPKRGEVYICDLEPTVGRELHKARPVIIISNNHLNELSDMVITIPITSGQHRYFHDIPIKPPEGGLGKKSIIVVEQIRAVDQKRLQKRLGRVKPMTLLAIEQALKSHLGLPEGEILA